MFEVPVIALVGRPNVGKSTLFNKLTCSRDAIVGDMAGVTRDRQYGFGQLHKTRHMIVDTGGMLSDSGFGQHIDDQVEQALQEADFIYFLVDAKSGLVADELEIANKLRSLNKPVHLVVNKTDVGDPDMLASDFFQLGFENIIKISAEHKRGIKELIADTLKDVQVIDPSEELENDNSIRVAIIGRPNVGKSTLTNRMLGEDRMVVFDKPGTTMDSVQSKLTRFDQEYTLIDTAGVRRKNVVTQALEKFSIIKTLGALDSCHVAILVLDSTEHLTDQDVRLLNYALQSGKATIVALNKWDNLPSEQKDIIKQQLQYRLKFAPYVKIQSISALHGSNVGLLFDFIQDAYKQAATPLTTNRLTDILYRAQMQNQPPLVQGRRIKLRYAHGGGNFPPTIIIHGNQAEKAPLNFKRYLMRFFMQALNMHSTPIKLIFKTTENPYKHKKNVLTKKQLNKRKRLIKNRIEKTKRKRNRKAKV